MVWPRKQLTHLTSLQDSLPPNGVLTFELCKDFGRTLNFSNFILFTSSPGADMQHVFQSLRSVSCQLYRRLNKTSITPNTFRKFISKCMFVSCIISKSLSKLKPVQVCERNFRSRLTAMQSYASISRKLFVTVLTPAKHKRSDSLFRKKNFRE